MALTSIKRDDEGEGAGDVDTGCEITATYGAFLEV